MRAFLEKCIEAIYSKHGSSLGDLCIVLPNRRAGLFLKKHLANQIDQAVFMPEIFSIEDFVSHQSGLTILDNLSLLFELFEVHKNINTTEDQDLHQFSDWAFQALHDFNEIDEYLVDAADLFSYLSDTKAIELWNPEKKSLTDFEKKYLLFFRSLEKYYILLRKRLEQKKIAYQGAAYRYLAENIQKIQDDIGYKKIYFLGFNALTRSEEKFIGHLVQTEQAAIFWDSDHYYLDARHQGFLHEAGTFLRSHFKNRIFSDAKWTFEHFKTAKEIQLSGVPQNIGQAKLCGEILKHELSEEQLSNTAVVLADESLLIPLLNSIPREIRELNITMGFPLESVPLYTFFDKVFQLKRNALNLKDIRNVSSGQYHLKDLLAICRHPLLQNLSEKLFQLRQHELNSKLFEFVKSGKVLLGHQEILQHFSSGTGTFMHYLLKDWRNNAVLALDGIFSIIEKLRQAISISGKKETLQVEYLYHFSLIFKRLKSIQEEYHVLDSVELLQVIFKQIVRNSSLPFYGEPLKGLQIMGMLETRTLDFENLVLLSANENILPSSRRQNSFIPFEIKKQFGLPTYRDRDSIYAYHFYRLLQRCKKAYLIYNTETDQLGGGDKSRFLLQLARELPAYNPDTKIKQNIYGSRIRDLKRSNEIIIEKTDILMDKLKEKSSHGLSASSLNQFRKCTLQFYFSSILELQEDKEVEESIDAANLGTIIHDSLQHIYSEFQNQVLNSEVLQQAKKSISQKISYSFKKKFPGGEAKHGKNLLILKAAESLIENVLRHDAEMLKDHELIIQELENKVTLEFPLNDQKDFKVKLKGYIDRMDMFDGKQRLLDYKTGYVDKNELSVSSEAEVKDKKFSNIAFQLLFYALIQIHKATQKPKGIQAAAMSLRKNKDLLINLQIDKNRNIDKANILFFENQLTSLLAEIFDKEKHFEQTNDVENCRHCAYNIICNREL